MAKLRFAVELEYDAEMMHGNDDEESKTWFIRDILGAPHLVLGDTGDVGDELGKIRVISPIEEVPGS